MGNIIVRRTAILLVLLFTALSTNIAEGKFLITQNGASSLRLGVNMHPLQDVYEPSLITQQIGLVRSIGASIVRIDIHWAWIEPNTPGVANWNQSQISRLDTFLNGLAGTDIQVLATVTETPCWASSDLNKNCGLAYDWRRYPHANPQDYANFLAAMVNHYGTRIRYWEVWSEPNLPYYWGSSYYLPYTPAAYTALLKTAYSAIKTQNPAAIVIGGALAPTENDSSTASMGATDYLTGMYQNGVKGYFDKLSYHPYTDGNTPTWYDSRWPMHSFSTSVPAIHQVMQNYNDSSSIWLTEIGWTTVPAVSCMDCWTPTLPRTETEQSEYMSDAINIARNWNYVEAFLWYELIDMIQPPDPSYISYDQYFGLYRKDFTPKPASENFTNIAFPNKIYLPLIQ